MTGSRAARVELLCIGSELLNGQVNTHQSYLSVALRSAGLDLVRESTLPDDAEAIASEVRQSLTRCDALLLCGGLGPTFDDLTREGVALALGRRLLYRPALFAEIKRKFLRARVSVPKENERQAYVIEGAEVLDNAAGSAPGQLLVLPRGGRTQLVAMMPGPFAELSPMFERQVLPRLRSALSPGVHTASLALHLSGVAESEADEALQPVTAMAGPELSFTILAGAGQVDFHARARAATRARTAALLARVRRAAYKAAGKWIFGEGAETLESAVGAELTRRRLTLAVAESCTAGLAGARLTKVPGSSAYFRGGVLSYADELKSAALGVEPRTLREHGAVSEQCAFEMARGARRLAGAGVGLALTGVAGPGGGTPQKPVGLVWLAIDGPGRRRAAWKLMLSGGRETVRARAVSAALHHLRRHVKGEWP